MADFLLSVGVDVGLSYDQMQKDISNLVSRLNNNPPKIRVDLEFDTAAITNLRTQISDLYQAVNSSGTTSGGGGRGGFRRATQQAREHTIALRTVVDMYTQMHSLMSRNTNATGTATWDSLSTHAQQFATVLELVQSRGITVNEALHQLGINGANFIENARVAMSAFRAEVEHTGASGSINMNQMYTIVSQMQTLLNNNAGAAGLTTYTELQNRVTLFANAIRLATTENISLESALERVGLSGSTAIEEARVAMSAFRAEVSGATFEEETLVTGTNEYYSALRQVNTLLGQVMHSQERWTAAQSGSSSAAYRDLGMYADELRTLEQQLRSGAITATDFRNRLAQIRAGVSTATNTIKAAGEATQTWGQRIGTLSAKFGTWFSITRVIMAAYRAVRQMVTNVIELDTAMTELKKVTNETDATYEKFLVRATSRAKKLGAALSDTISATADFARLGYGMEDAEKLADAAIVYKNVGDGIEDIGTASESIIATMQAFSIPAEQVMSIVDRFNEVGNNFAISSKGVGDALLRSASALHSANNTLDESIALAAAANTIVQDPDKVGTALKTVSMYLRAAKTDAEEAGESTDGMANSISELREELLALTGNKVDIQLDENTFKSTYQILKELSVVWGELSDVSQANILEMVGGKRNSNVVSALLENFSVAEEAIKTSANSANSALEENEKVLESIQGKINIMKATFETLSQNLIGSDIVKLVIDMGTGFMELINGVLQVVDALGGLKTVLLTLSAVLLISKGGLIAYKATLLGIAAVQKIITFFNGIKTAISTIINIIPNAIVAWKSYAAGVVSANTAMQASIPVIGLVLAAISAVVAGIALFSGSSKDIEELNSEWESLSNTIESASNKFKSLRDEADDIIPKYAELAQGVDKYGKNVSLTSEEFSEFVSLNNRLGEMFPDLVRGYDSNGNAILNLSGNVDTLTESLYACVEAQRVAAAQEIADTMPDVMKNIADSVKGYEKSIKDERKAGKKEKEAIQAKIDNYQQAYDEFTRIYSDEYEQGWRETYGDNWTKMFDADISMAETTMVHYLQEMIGSQEKWQKLFKQYEVENWESGPIADWEGLINSKEMQDALAVAQSQLNNFDAGLEKQIEDFNNRIASKWKQLNPVVSAWLQTDFMYQDLESGGQDIASRMMKSIDFSSLGLKTAEEVQQYIKDYVINPIYDMDEDAKSAFYKILDIEKSLDEGKISAQDYIDQINEIISSANLTDDTTKYIKLAFDIDGIQGKIDHVKGLLSDEFDDMASSLTIEELEIAYKITKDSGSMSFDQLKAEINELKNTISTSPIETWDDLGRVFDTYTQKMQGLSSIQEAVTNGFIISADAAREFAATYPEILQYATSAGNGQIKLNADVVNNFLSGKQAELKGSIDSQIAQLEAEKSTLEAKRAAAEAQLELAKSVGEGEGQIAADVAAYRIDCGNIMTQAMIDMGIDEATAFKLAAAAMAGNVDEFNRIAADVCTDVNGNFNQAAYNAAQAIYNNMHNSKLSVASFAKQCHEAAKAMAGIAKGEVNGSEGVVGGGAGGTFGNGIKITLHDGSFDGSDYSYEAKEFALDEFISDLELDISNYTSKIAEIDGQIAVLQALKNKPLEQFNPDYGKNNGGNGGSDKSKDKDTKEVEEYVASVERYSEALQKLHDAEVKQAQLERDLENADTALEKVDIQKSLINAYKERQQALHELNNLRDTTIQNAIPELQALGFEIEYNADTNRLYISNLEHLNELQAESAGEYETTQEATNALRKETEELIDDITSLNEENQNCSETWLDLADSINKGKENIVELLNDVVTEAVDFVSAMQDVYTTLKDAAGEYYETGTLSVDTLKAIAEYGAEYMNYLKDENGMLSINKERIEAVIEARTKQLAVDTAMSYVEKIRYALSENNVKELNRLITATEQASDATWSLVYSNLALLDLDESQYTQALSNINRLRSLAYDAVESIKLGTDEANNGYDDMQDALDTILDLTMELVEYEVNQEIEALEKQKDNYREIIDLKKEALETTKEESNYNKEVTKKVAEIAKIQAKIDKLSLDDSREAKAEKAALEQELAELQTDLSDYQTDYSVDKQQEMLDKMADSYEEEKDEEIKILEDSISSTEKIYQLAINRINEDWDSLYDDIISWNYEAGSSIESEIVAAWELASKAVQEYGSYIEATNKLATGVTGDNVDLGASGNYGDPKAIINQMRSNSLKWFTASDAEQSQLSSANKTLASQLSSIYEQGVTSKNGTWYLDGETDPLYSIGKWEAVDFITKAMKNNSAKWSGASPSERAELEKANEKMAKYIADLSGQKVWKDSDGVWWIDNAKLYESYGTYHTGGVVGDSTLKKDEVMAILKDGELILDEKREEGLYKLVDFAQILSERLGTTIDTSKFDNLFGGFSLLPTSRDLLPAAHAGSALTEFSPHIEVNISHNGSMSDDDARRYGGLIAETALGELKDAFTKKGITNLGSSALK